MEITYSQNIMNVTFTAGLFEKIIGPVLVTIVFIAGAYIFTLNRIIGLICCSLAVLSLVGFFSWKQEIVVYKDGKMKIKNVIFGHAFVKAIDLNNSKISLEYDRGGEGASGTNIVFSNNETRHRTMFLLKNRKEGEKLRESIEKFID